MRLRGGLTSGQNASNWLVGFANRVTAIDPSTLMRSKLFFQTSRYGNSAASSVITNSIDDHRERAAALTHGLASANCDESAMIETLRNSIRISRATR